MKFQRHKLVGADYNQAKWIGGNITPRIVVLHDTASRMSRGSAARYLQNNSAKVSVHFVVEVDGTITQQVPINRRANHAGRSNYHGDEGCNDFSIGIEIVNPGRLTRASSKDALAWYGVLFDIEQHCVQEVTTKEHGRGLWMPYAEAQMDAVLELLAALFDYCDTLQDVTTHWYVSPGRKVDTNPLFPLDHIRARILGRDDPNELVAEENSDPATDGPMVTVDTNGDSLNIRRWPSFNPNVIGSVPDGTLVPVLRKGTFGGREWLKIFYGGHEGWVVARYTNPAK